MCVKYALSSPLSDHLFTIKANEVSIFYLFLSPGCFHKEGRSLIFHAKISINKGSEKSLKVNCILGREVPSTGRTLSWSESRVSDHP